MVGNLKHLAVIMDGNRRWAKKNNLHYSFGYQKGIESVKLTIQFCIENNIQYLSLYTFSLENFKRPLEEQSFIFKMFAQKATLLTPYFIEHDVKINIVGDRTLFPKFLVSTIDALENETNNCNKLILNLLFCYGARQEIVAAAKCIAQQIEMKKITSENVNDELFKSVLWSCQIPDPDLVIRTSGIQRLSNFLLYQIAYSEFYFIDCLWPELKEVHLKNALDSWYIVKKNFGV